MILDCHTHAFPDNIAAGAIKALSAEPVWMPVHAYHEGTVRALLASMDSAGIDRAILCSVATKPAQVRKITDWSASIASDRIIPFASIHPDFDAPEQECQRIASLGLRGVKFHSQYMNCAIDDPRALRIARAAADANLSLTLHAGYDLSFPKDELSSPRQILTMHQAAPSLRILACHMGGWQRWDEVLELLAGRPIWMETSFAIGQCPQDLLARIIARHGREHLLFGTDSPWADQQRELAMFDLLPISAEAKGAAKWTNGLAFLGA